MSEVVVDARGLRCPLPRMKLELALREIDPGTTIRLLTDDPEAPLDITAWCLDNGLEAEEKSRESRWEFVVRPK